MIKKERIVTWEDQEIFCCDNCGARMNLIHADIYDCEKKYHYSCPRCGLEVKSPVEFPTKPEFRCPNCRGYDIVIQGRTLDCKCKICGVIGKLDDFKEKD